MSEKRRATKEDERELKSKLSLFIIILMILSLTVCNKPAQQEQAAENAGSDGRCDIGDHYRQRLPYCRNDGELARRFILKNM